MSNRKPEPGAVAAGRKRYRDRYERPPVTERECDGEDLIADPVARGEAVYAARRGHRLAVDALASARGRTATSAATD